MAFPKSDSIHVHDGPKTIVQDFITVEAHESGLSSVRVGDSVFVEKSIDMETLQMDPKIEVLSATQRLSDPDWDPDLSCRLFIRI
jgi:hypothetical protein